MAAPGGTGRRFRPQPKQQPGVRAPSGVMRRDARAREGQTFAQWNLPGNGYGSISSEGRAIIKQLTGVSACIKKRDDWDSHKLTLAGPKEGMARAKSMAMDFILQSQIRNPWWLSRSASASSEYLAPSMPTQFAMQQLAMQQMAMHHMAMQQIAMQLYPRPSR